MLGTHKTSGRLHSRLLRLERYFAARARTSESASAHILPTAKLDTWAQHYLPSYFARPFSLFHVWLAERLQDLHLRRGSRMALVAPPGSAKSTWISLAYPLWVALNAYESYVLLISDTQAQARLLLEALKRELEDNPALAEAYPGAVGQGSPWGQD